VLAASKRISNPGCYPTGFLALVRPLVDAGIIPADLALSVNASSGYSGGGKAMIAAFEEADHPEATHTAFRAYALGLGHKHVPEMQGHAGLQHPPIFQPAVVQTYRGMLVEVPLHLYMLKGGISDIRTALADHYAGSDIVKVTPESQNPAVLEIEQCAGTDRMELFIYANEKLGQLRLIATLDNLGKGAGGAAVQNLNIALGKDPKTGLNL
jgi:N-acetyl-gamma-glutamyl-phosphate reductase